MNSAYNDIKAWNWQKLLDVFDPPAGSYASHKATTRRELEDLLNGPLLKDESRIHLVECVLGRLDIPRALSAVSRMSAPQRRVAADADLLLHGFGTLQQAKMMAEANKPKVDH